MTGQMMTGRMLRGRAALFTFPLMVVLLLGGCGGERVGTSSVDDPAMPDPAPSDPPAEVEPDASAPDVTPDNGAAADVPTAELEPPPEEAGTAETAEQGLAFETTLIPGERVGPLTHEMSRQELADQVGEAQLTDTEVYVGEGFMEPGTQVDLGNGYSFSVIWADAARTRPREVRDLSAKWQTPEGIGMGTSFAMLQEVIGPFELFGFAWDYGGTILLEDTQLSEYAGLLTLRVTPSLNSAQTAAADYAQVTGDRTFSSTNPHLQPLDIEVYDMIVTLSTAE